MFSPRRVPSGGPRLALAMTAIVPPTAPGLLRCPARSGRDPQAPRRARGRPPGTLPAGRAGRRCSHERSARRRATPLARPGLHRARQRHRPWPAQLRAIRLRWRRPPGILSPGRPDTGVPMLVASDSSNCATEPGSRSRLRIAHTPTQPRWPRQDRSATTNGLAADAGWSPVTPYRSGEQVTGSVLRSSPPTRMSGAGKPNIGK
jgi:hypothetical protein